MSVSWRDSLDDFIHFWLIRQQNFRAIANLVCLTSKLIGAVVGTILFVRIFVLRKPGERQLILPQYRPITLFSVLFMYVHCICWYISHFSNVPENLKLITSLIQVGADETAYDGLTLLLIKGHLGTTTLQSTLWQCLFLGFMGSGWALLEERGFISAGMSNLIFHLFFAIAYLYIIIPLPISISAPKRNTVRAYGLWMLLFRLSWFNISVLSITLYNGPGNTLVNPSFLPYILFSLFLIMLVELPFAVCIFAIARSDTVYWVLGGRLMVKQQRHQMLQSYQPKRRKKNKKNDPDPNFDDGFSHGSEDEYLSGNLSRRSSFLQDSLSSTSDISNTVDYLSNDSSRYQPELLHRSIQSSNGYNHNYGHKNNFNKNNFNNFNNFGKNEKNEKNEKYINFTKKETKDDMSVSINDLGQDHLITPPIHHYSSAFQPGTQFSTNLFTNNENKNNLDFPLNNSNKIGDFSEQEMNNNSKAKLLTTGFRTNPQKEYNYLDSNDEPLLLDRSMSVIAPPLPQETNKTKILRMLEVFSAKKTTKNASDDQIDLQASAFALEQHRDKIFKRGGGAILKGKDEVNVGGSKNGGKNKGKKSNSNNNKKISFFAKFSKSATTTPTFGEPLLPSDSFGSLNSGGSMMSDMDDIELNTYPPIDENCDEDDEGDDDGEGDHDDGFEGKSLNNSNKNNQKKSISVLKSANKNAGSRLYAENDSSSSGGEYSEFDDSYDEDNDSYQVDYKQTTIISRMKNKNKIDPKIDPKKQQRWEKCPKFIHFWTRK